MASFTHHQNIAANVTKSRGSLFTAKGAGNLLLKLNHPEVVFSEIVGKRPSMSEAGIARKVRLLTGQINAVELACQAYLFGWTRNRKVVMGAKRMEKTGVGGSFVHCWDMLHDKSFPFVS